MNYRQLLIKYINHVGMEEGTTFLNFQGSWDDSVEFTDEEWAELKQLEAIKYEDLKNHSCSCHARNAGPCDICKVLGCEVWDFNQVEPWAGLIEVPEEPPFKTGLDHATLYVHDHTTPMFLDPDTHDLDPRQE